MNQSLLTPHLTIISHIILFPYHSMIGSVNAKEML